MEGDRDSMAIRGTFFLILKNSFTPDLVFIIKTPLVRQLALLPVCVRSF